MQEESISYNHVNHQRHHFHDNIISAVDCSNKLALVPVLLYDSCDDDDDDCDVISTCRHFTDDRKLLQRRSCCRHRAGPSVETQRADDERRGRYRTTLLHARIHHQYGKSSSAPGIRAPDVENMQPDCHAANMYSRRQEPCEYGGRITKRSCIRSSSSRMDCCRTPIGGVVVEDQHTSVITRQDQDQAAGEECVECKTLISHKCGSVERFVTLMATTRHLLSTSRQRARLLQKPVILCLDFHRLARTL